MERQTNQRRPFGLPATVAVIVLLGAFAMTFAQTGQEQPKGSLAEEIVGAWNGQTANDDEGDKLTFTFNKDNSVAVGQGKHVDNATYSLTGPDEVEVKAPNRPTLKFKIKIAGDTMEMTNVRGQTLELQRVK